MDIITITLGRVVPVPPSLITWYYITVILMFYFQYYSQTVDVFLTLVEEQSKKNRHILWQQIFPVVQIPYLTDIFFL